MFNEFLLGDKSAKKLKHREAGAKRAIRRTGSAAEAGCSRGFWSQQEARVSEKRFRRPALALRGAADLRVTASAADPRTSWQACSTRLPCVNLGFGG